MPEYGLAHAYPWKGMKGITRGGEAVTLIRLWPHYANNKLYLTWWPEKFGCRYSTDLSGRYYYKIPDYEGWLDIIWWELPTAEQVLALPTQPPQTRKSQPPKGGFLLSGANK